MAFMNDITSHQRAIPERFRRVVFTTQYLHELNLYLLPAGEVLLKLCEAGQTFMVLQFDDEKYAEQIASGIVEWVAEHPQSDRYDLIIWIKTRAEREAITKAPHHIY